MSVKGEMNKLVSTIIKKILKKQHNSTSNDDGVGDETDVKAEHNKNGWTFNKWICLQFLFHGMFLLVPP